MATPTILVAAELRRTFVDAQHTIEALRGVGLSIAKGEFVALVGSSGSGKSTLLHTLGGIDRPTAGSVVIDGKDLAVMSERDLTAFRSARIGFVFQYFNLIGSLSVYENVALPFIVAERNKKEDRDRVADMIELFGLRGRETRSPMTLSAGEQQRIAIARAFLTEPAIVIADEPTGSLDPATGVETLQLLWESCDNFKQTVVLATHDPQAAAFADRVLFIKDGAIADEYAPGRREEHHDAGPVLDRLRRLTF